MLERLAAKLAEPDLAFAKDAKVGGMNAAKSIRDRDLELFLHGFT